VSCPQQVRSGVDHRAFRPWIALCSMRQLFPTPVDDVDVVSTYASDDRPSPADRPWVMLNMISSVDGGISVDGVSGGLGGPADKVVFSAIRGVADIILVAAGTVIAEDYRRPQTPPIIQEQRIGRGQEPIPRIAIVTNNLSIDPTHRVFDPEARPIVVTKSEADRDRVSALDPVADIVFAGETAVNVAAAVRSLGELGARVVLVEGGPTFNSAVVAADLIDELCLTVSPLLLGGDGPRIVNGGTPERPLPLRLDRILEQDDLLFHRFVRA
jgi:riboflavin-specific deaminase-like protein